VTPPDLRQRLEWKDRERDSIASLERFADGGHPHIVATLKLAGGPDDAQVGIYLEAMETLQVIAWLQEALGHWERGGVAATSEPEG
jgi:hypothetical protein